MKKIYKNVNFGEKMCHFVSYDSLRGQNLAKIWPKWVNFGQKKWNRENDKNDQLFDHFFGLF